MTKSFLSQACKDLIPGSLLGDGSIKIHSGYRNARFSFRHSIKQKDYFFWKIDRLREISSEKCWWKQKSGFGNSEVLRYQSNALPALSELYYLTHPNGSLRIRRKWLNKLTPLSLAVWWLDDGSIIANGRKGVICTDAFSEKENKLLIVKVQSVLSKVILLYKDSDLQQRWISEVSDKTGFSQDIVSRYIFEKKQKWKNFRE